jgi:hypothetical protein
MCTSSFARRATMTARFESASRRQCSNLNHVDLTEVCNLPLNMRWVIETEDNGNRTLCMHRTGQRL